MIHFRRIAFLCFAASFVCMAASSTAAVTPGGGGTTVTVEGSTVTITVHFDLCCIPDDASERDVWTPLVRAEIKAAQDQWNQALANLPAKGCYELRVVFDARLLNKSDGWDQGYHRINMSYTEGRSGSQDPESTSPNTDDDTVYQQSVAGNFYEPSMSVGTWAHEIGHLMGLGDDYFAQHGLGHRAQDCLPGRDGTLMCDSGTGAIDQDLADRLADILSSDGLLPQCWKGTIKISVASYKGPRRCTDSWTADMKILVSDKGVASGTGTANRASAVVCGHATPCPSPQVFTFNIAGQSDQQTFRLKYSTTGASPAGACDYSAFGTVLPGFPTPRINTITSVATNRAEAHYQVTELFGASTGSFDTALDCESCDTHIKQVQPDGQRR
jgi:hypothetical protein